MENIVKELGINNKNICPSSSHNLFNVVVHNCWLKKLIKNKELDCSVNNVDFILQPGENVPHPWRKIFIRVLNKKVSKVLPLPRYKLNEGSHEFPLTFSQLLQYVSQNNQRNLWKQSYKNYSHNQESNKEKTVVNLLEHDQLLSEILSRFYGCNIIRIKNDESGKFLEFSETVRTKYNIQKCYESHVNLLAALFIIETDQTYFVIYRSHYENTLLDCLNFSPNLVDSNYTRGLFVVYQLLNAVKAVSDRGLSIGQLKLQDIYLMENFWLQILPVIKNNVHSLDAKLVHEQQSKTNAVAYVSQEKRDELYWRNKVVELEKLCMLWVRGQISNLDYLLHLNLLAGRQADDPQTHFLVPWVTDFTSRCGRIWRDLSKSKYRLNKGDQQLDLTYDVSECVSQIPHHVTDALSDITCYVYLARRTPKEILCKHVRNKWVPAEYPASIQRMQEWSPDECIPEFYTDPTVFKSIHEDLPDLGIPTWATCVEDFVSKHREALESTHVSDNLHHWIDITFGYKLSGCAAVKAKNVCLSLVDGHTAVRRGAPVQVFAAPHPPRQAPPAPPAPPRLHWTAPRDKKAIKPNDSSEEISDEEEESTSLPQHVSRLTTPSQRARSRHKSSSRARSLSKSQSQGHEDSPQETRASSHSRHYRVQRSELGKGVIYLPKEFNPIAPIQALECMDNFRTKCFFSKAETTKAAVNIPIKREITTNEGLDDSTNTNQMLDTSNELTNSSLESVLKEKKNRSFNTRFTTDATVYKQIITEHRKQDMLVVGCLMVEIFLHNYMRPLRTNSDDFAERYNSCRTVLKYNFSSLPKCVSYVASLLLNVEPPCLSFRSEITPKSPKPVGNKVVTDKGLPSPSASQLLQPLLMQHLIPFPQSFNTLHKLLSTLHEYDLASTELNILYTYQCDGVQCEKYQNVDKTKLYFNQKIAEGKIHACAVQLDVLLNQITSSNQINVLDIFFTHYIELLENKDTSVLAAWYLFDTVSKALGPDETKTKLLKPILNLYDDDDFVMNKSEHKLTDLDCSTSSRVCKQKFLKLYHNIFLLQLMVRFGLQCFLDNFTQHLVEAVGGYKDMNNELSSPGHICRSIVVTNKKPRYSDDTVKNALSITTEGNIFSPDTSYGSEHIITPNVENKTNTETVLIEPMKEKDADTRSENELFHFESDKEGLNPSRSSRSKSPADSIESYTLNAQDTLSTYSPLTDIYSPTVSKDFSPNIRPSSSKELNLTISKDDNPAEENPKRAPMSPTIDIPSKNSMFTSYLHFANEDSKDVEIRKETHSRQIKSLELNRNVELSVPKTSRSFSEDMNQNLKDMEPCKISEMSSESLIWLAHRLGPVLSCRYITRNLLKMLTLCYIGKENLAPWSSDENDEFDDISIANSKVVGDKNAMKVIKCLTAIVAMYGEQLIIFQYLPHMGELIASCRRRLTVPLEGGVVACLQLLKYLIPYMSDAKVMEQLQDTFLKSILQPVLRLCATSRSACPSGVAARRALATKLLDALHALALRVGPEMTRNHLATTTLMRFFLAFDKATGKIDNWPKQEENVTDKVYEGSSAEGCLEEGEGFLEICRDGSTAEWAVRGGRVVRADLPDLPCSPPDHPPDHSDAARLTAQEELLIVFNEELAYRAYSTFAKFIGTEAMERSLKNMDTIQAMYQMYEQNNTICSPLRLCHQEKRVQLSFSDEPLSRKVLDVTPTKPEEHMTYSNSFGSNVTLVGNRIDVNSGADAGCSGQGRGFDVVAYKTDNGVKSSRHLRGDWLIYWEHEIGRPEKENRFNLKQIKLQTFLGHSHSVKSIHCLDNENSFMSGSKDKTVRLWSLRNQGDGNATSQCNWSYTGHKKGVLSLAFIESLRLAVSTDSVVHIWDPFMESVVSQLDNIKSGVSIVRALPGPSAAVLAATTDGTLKIIDARACNYTHDLKVPMSATTFIRCMCTSGSGTWVCVGLASGHVALLDVRTGAPRRTWRAHDGEVLRVAAVDERRVLTSGLDQTTALWSADDGELIAHLKGTTEPVHCLSVYYNELISGTTNNRIGVHTSLDQDASFSSTKLRSDTFRGVLTCMSVLSLNRLLLLGSDNGTISLLC